MKTTMDKAGRIVIPAQIRERLGMVPGPVDMVIDGNGIRIEIETHDDLVEDDDGRLVIRATGVPLTTEMIREMRLADQR
ncbi:AbrB/MazE/SpoVT family DNA-binding domain-containing protein [Microbacterium resistens]|nr:AbrB/MazE/SpoVT family DNA-binding domain-containing protein [Microbacterium resistens]